VLLRMRPGGRDPASPGRSCELISDGELGPCQTSAWQVIFFVAQD
jgi:hypothetical protein